MSGSICLVANDLIHLDRRGGMGASFWLQAQLLARHGWRVQLLYAGPAAEPATVARTRHLLDRDGIELTQLDDLPTPADVHVPSAGPTSADIQRSERARVVLNDLHRQHAFDLIQFGDFHALGFRAVQAKKSGLALGDAGLIVKLHGMGHWVREQQGRWSNGPADLVTDFAERFAFEHADIQIAASRWVLGYARSIGWQVRTDAQVVYNPLAEPEFPRSEVGRDGAPEVVFFGRLEIGKGLGIFLDALEHFDPGIAVTFLGRDTWVKEGLLASSWIRSRTHGRQVQLLMDCNREQALTYLSRPNRLAVIPSLGETFCHAVAECAVNGIPFLASRVGGIPEIVADPRVQQQVLFEPNARGLLRALERTIHADPSQARTWRERVVQTIDRERHNRQIVSFYDQCLAQRRRRNTASIGPAPGGADRPAVTVVVRHCDQAMSLPASVASLARQTYPNLDVWIIDDGSTELESLRVFEEQEQRYPRFRFIRQDAAGTGGTRNHVLAQARGELFVPLDAADIAADRMIECLVRALHLNPACAAMACYVRAASDAGDPVERRSDWADRPPGGPLVLGSLVNVFGECGILRAADLRAVGGYDTDPANRRPDWLTLVKLVCSGRQVGVVPDYLVSRWAPAGPPRETMPDEQACWKVLKQVIAYRELSEAERVALWAVLAGYSRLPDCIERSQRLAEEMRTLPHRLARRLDRLIAKVPGTAWLSAAVRQCGWHARKAVVQNLLGRARRFPGWLLRQMLDVGTRLLRRLLKGPAVTLSAFWPSIPLLAIMRWLNEIQLSPAELQAIARSIKRRPACRLLVFGLGNDSVFWSRINNGGQTLFLEDDPSWFRTVTGRQRSLAAQLVEYGTRRPQWVSLLGRPDLLDMRLPPGVAQATWDVILVDAPAGSSDTTPGRMKSIFLASRLVAPAGEVFVHDCDREVERAYTDRFLSLVGRKGEVEKLRHYQAAAGRRAA